MKIGVQNDKYPSE